MKKKILFIIWSYSYGGGAETVLKSLVNNMDFEKYEIDIIEYWHSNNKTEETDKRVGILQPIIDSTKDSKIKMVITKIILEHFPILLRKKFIKKKYDYEIAFNYMIPTFLLSKKGKTISWNHGDIYDLKYKKRDKFLQDRSYRYVNKIVAISQNTYNSIVEIFPKYKEKTMIINNSIDLNDVYKKAEQHIEIEKTNFTILFAGRFDENKNPDLLIETAKALKNKKIEFEMWLLGKGELQEKIENKIKLYKLEKECKILGYKENPYPYFKKADLIMLCSKSEGFPTVLAEGLALGKPFVSTNVGGIQELSSDGKCGIINSTSEEFSCTIEKLKNDKNLYIKMSDYGKKYINTFSFENQIKRIENLFNEIDNTSK